jgi:Large polyvalent protein-associated domain 7
MDDANPPRRSQSADRNKSAGHNETDGIPTANGAPENRPSREGLDAQEATRFTVELRSPDGQPVSRTSGNDTWRAMHEFAGWASLDLGHRLGAGASAALVDRDGGYGVKLQIDATGANQLQFDTDVGRALYKQIYRERQLALSQAPMSNRIEAETSAAEQPSSARVLPPTPQMVGATNRLRQSVLEHLHQSTEPQTEMERLQQERDRQIASRATFAQLTLIAAEPARDDPARLRKLLDRIQLKVESQVGQHQSTAHKRSPQVPPNADRGDDDAERASRRLNNDPPIRERFTAIEHSWRTDYWQRDRPDRLGFTETWLTLKTAEHSASVIMGMVDRARELGWTKLHLDGSPEFKREAWILATARGLGTSGYTATLGDREAVKVEQQRLSQASHHRSRSPPAQERIVQKDSSPARQEASSSERTAGPARDSHLNAAITKAMHEARVPAGLQARLREMIKAEAQRRETSAPQWRVRVYDSATQRGRSAPEVAARTAKPDRQHER